MTDEEIIELIYLVLALTTNDIPVAVVQLFLDEWQDIYTDVADECLVLYHTTISVYNWLIRSANAKAVSGKRREKKGRREIEVEDSNSAENWQKALDNFTVSPWLSFPQCRSIFAANTRSRIIIGGVKKDEVERVQEDSNSYSQYSEKSPFSPRGLVGRRAIRGFKL